MSAVELALEGATRSASSGVEEQSARGRAPRRARVARALLLLLLLLAPLSCRWDENEPDVHEHPDEFSWFAVLDDYSAVESYRWSTYYENALVEFEGWDFDGEIRIEIFDDSGFLIYEDCFSGTGGYRYSLDETDDGADGEWEVVITSSGADGWVNIWLF